MPVSFRTPFGPIASANKVPRDERRMQRYDTNSLSVGLFCSRGHQGGLVGEGTSEDPYGSRPTTRYLRQGALAADIRSGCRCLSCQKALSPDQILFPPISFSLLDSKLSTVISLISFPVPSLGTRKASIPVQWPSWSKTCRPSNPLPWSASRLGFRAPQTRMRSGNFSCPSAMYRRTSPRAGLVSIRSITRMRVVGGR